MRIFNGGTSAFILTVQNLFVTFDITTGNKNIQIQAVRGVTFSMKRGEILGIVGESGSGKSVSTTAISGLLPGNAFVEGRIFFKGIELTSLSQDQFRELRGRKIGCIFQEPGRSFDPIQSIGNVFAETLKIQSQNFQKKNAKNALWSF